MGAAEQPGAAVQILDFEPGLACAFRDLNVEWLERYFRVEPVDEKILGDPVSSIIEPGGAILFASMGGRIVGTVALRNQGGGVFELTKMAVTTAAQGCGIGRRLLEAALRRYARLGGERLYLASHSSLHAALSLYESAGFAHEPPPSPSAYARADIYMVYRAVL